MKLLLPAEFADELKPHLSPDRYPDIQLAWVDSQGNFEGDPSDAEVYLNWFYLKSATLQKVLAAAPHLRWQQTPSAGVNHILTPAYLERKILLTNGAGTFAVPIAEFVMAYILSYAKSLPKLKDLQDQKTWLRSDSAAGDLPLQEVEGTTLLIVGAGSIGQEIAKRAHAFDMRVWGSRRNPDPLPHFDRIVGADEWRSLLPEVDYLVLATPLTPETRGMINAATLRLMRSTAYLINIARGAVVDESALLTALQEGWIAGAGLDTFCTEPLPEDSPFWSLPNVFVTPHCSGFSPRIAQRTIALFLDNLWRYQNGVSLRNLIDQTAGY
ncbi:MAG: D-2-hydroxyacid dehydrogenase [Drouetiella hepatica Uher 2000/2452]|jgi:phosphoglycerate dehydrogenase-like enzyme|uniref:D-2-hydroxyacid dehydrogenase n=1 Tax=Drouetiella hepatica Uher 2000/2452 TaxID=904376 RepID=A0A951QE93_9CYAN|nr:D-2-hydroxyacid dehydrogenase [Drouetiella hepatica Uher 2000/2452]